MMNYDQRQRPEEVCGLLGKHGLAAFLILLSIFALVGVIIDAHFIDYYRPMDLSGPMIFRIVNLSILLVLLILFLAAAIMLFTGYYPLSPRLIMISAAICMVIYLIFSIVYMSVAASRSFKEDLHRDLNRTYRHYVLDGKKVPAENSANKRIDRFEEKLQCCFLELNAVDVYEITPSGHVNIDVTKPDKIEFYRAWAKHCLDMAVDRKFEGADGFKDCLNRVIEKEKDRGFSSFYSSIIHLLFGTLALAAFNYGKTYLYDMEGGGQANMGRMNPGPYTTQLDNNLVGSLSSNRPQ